MQRNTQVIDIAQWREDDSAQAESFQHDSRTLESLIRSSLERVVHKLDPNEPGDLHDMVTRIVEKPLIELVLKRANGNQCKAANMLGINRNTLHKKVKSLQINVRLTKNC